MKKSSRDIPKCNNPWSGHENMSYLRNIAYWYKLGYKPPEMEKVIFTLVTFRFFLSLLCNKHKIYCSLSFEQKFYIMSWYKTLTILCLLSLFYDCFLLQGIRSHWYQTFDCLSVFRSLEEKKEVNKLISLQCWITCLIIQSPWLAAKGYKNNFWVTIPPFFFLLINRCTSCLGHKSTAKNSVSGKKILMLYS